MWILYLFLYSSLKVLFFAFLQFSQCFYVAFFLLFFCICFSRAHFSNRISGAFVLLLVHILINPGFHRLCLLKTDLNLAVSLALPLPYQLRV